MGNVIVPIIAVGVGVCLLFCPDRPRPVQHCPPVSSPPQNGYVDCNGYKSGSSCTFSCLSGFQLSHSERITCQGTRWSRNSPQCNRIQCPSFPDIPSHLEYTCNNNFQFESVCSFRCSRQGYSTCSNYYNCYAALRICKANRAWSGPYPTCYDKAPPRLTCPLSREVYTERGRTDTLVDWNTPQVEDNSGETIIPRRTEGPPPGSVLTEGIHLIQYEATDSASNTAECLFSITVKVKKCSVHMPSFNQLIQCTLQSVFGSVCAFDCAIGFCLVGRNELTCEELNSGTNRIRRSTMENEVAWNYPQPSCQRVTCPDITLPDHGQLQPGYICSNTYGGVCRVECEQGYDLVGTSQLQCAANHGADCLEGYWEGQFSCARVTCTQAYLPYQSVLANPDVCDSSVRAVGGTVCEYQCNTGYILVGDSTLTCDEQGEWSHRFPRCQIVKCNTAELPAPVNGTRIACDTPYVDFGSVCILGCHQGFMPTTQHYVACEDGGMGVGEWSDTTLTCEAVKCNPPELSVNTQIVKCTSGFSQTVNTDVDQLHEYGSTCTFTCDEGYVSLGGDSSRTCMISAQWNGAPLDCIDNQPPNLVCPQPRIYYADRAHIFTDVNYEWEPVQVMDLGRIRNASLVYIDNQQVVNTRNRFYEGDHTLTYQVVDLSGNIATCAMTISVRVTRCYSVPIPANAHSELLSGEGACQGRPVYGSECVIRCDDGYHLPANSVNITRTCERIRPSDAVGYWSGQNFACQANTCFVPPIANGYVVGCAGYPNQEEYQTTCQFRCNLGYEAASDQGVVYRTCLQDGTWSGHDLFCQAVQCQGYDAVDNANIQPPTCITADTLPYTNVCSFYCDAGYSLYGPQYTFCTLWGLWSDTRSTTCTDVQNPVFDTPCPFHVNTETKRNRRTATVNFSEPTATDNSGEMDLVRRNFGDSGPGMDFPEGQTRIVYLAEDSSGNSARCDVIVDVTVRRCQVLSAPNSGTITCDNGVIYGATCHFTCNQGYEIIGTETRTCELDSGGSIYWTGIQPQCNAISCPAIPDRDNVLRIGCMPPPAVARYGTVCYWFCPPSYNADGTAMSRCLANGTWSSNDFNCEAITCPALSLSTGMEAYPSNCETTPSLIGDYCLVSCTQNGYRIYPRTAEEIRCRSSGQWSQNIQSLQCEDFERPHFSNCPLSQTIYAGRGELTAIVEWNVAAEDNSGLIPTVTCNIEKGVARPEGDYYVVCRAEDAAGNEGK